MTISASVILVLLIGLYSTGNGINLANNTTYLLVLLIALIALSFATNSRRRWCFNNFQSSQINNDNFLNEFLI